MGRSSFSLATLCDEVIGIDYSKAFIEAAKCLQWDGEDEVEILRAGTIVEPLTIKASQLTQGRLQFKVGDAHALRND